VFARNVGQVNVALMLHSRVPLRLGELARASDLPRQIVASALRTLEKRGIATRTRAGDHDVFAPDTSSPYYPSAYLAALVDLPIAKALGRHRAMAAYLYGSMAVPGGGSPRSDIDLLLVGDFTDKEEVRVAVGGIGERLERRVDALLLSPEELEAGRRSGDAHVRAALAGVRLFGET
jgi:predicted nucleotidyltransferase